MNDEKVSVKEALDKLYDLSAHFATPLEHLIYRCGLNFYYQNEEESCMRCNRRRVMNTIPSSMDKSILSWLLPSECR